jgi:hypothetical protein
MENNENFVADQVTENVEQTTEETPKKMFSQEELNDIVGKAKARERAKVTKQFERQNSELNELVETLRAGTGKQSVREMNDTLTDFYEKKGIPISKKPSYTAKDLEVLAQAEADDYIRGGLEDVVEEVDRLADIGVDNMNAREKAVFKILAEHRQKAERSQELSSIGVTEEEYNSPEFQEFAGMFKADTPIEKVYAQYQKNKPQKEIKTMGSMKNSESGDNGVKEFYSPEEARAFTKKDYDNNPALFAAVERSMLKWKR